MVWRTHGNAASIVGAVCSTPGIIASAQARVGGKAAFRLSRAGCASSSTTGRSRTVSLRSASSEASAPIVVLKLVMRSFSWPSLLDSAAVTFCWPAISLEMSWRSRPSRAWFTIAVPRKASGP